MIETIKNAPDESPTRRPTIADVARKAGVGVATVDRVINKRARVRPETANRVLEAAEAIGFRASSLIRTRVEESGEERTLGFILQKRTTPFYRLLAKALSDATKGSAALKGLPVVEFMEQLTPQAMVKTLEQLSEKADAIGLVAADHPHINQAVDKLAANGIPTVTLLTDLSTPSRAGYVGIDNRMAGRTAAWTITRLSKRPGKVGIIMGSHRYLCQELCEVSFRSYCRENAPTFQIVEAVVNLEDPSLAQEATLELLDHNPDMVGLYCAGGGVEGVIAALREMTTPGQLVTVCNELTEQTRSALIDGVVDLVIAHRCEELAVKAVETMANVLAGRANQAPTQWQLPFDIFISENV